MVETNKIYRHFKGGYYLVIAIALDENDPFGDNIVVYKSLNGDNKIWSRKLSEFEEVIPSDRENPTGQTLRFCEVLNIADTLNSVSTSRLVEEIQKRNDNPYVSFDEKDENSNLLDVDFAVCTFSPSTDSYEILCSFGSLESARNFLMNNPNRISSRTTLVKRLLVKQEI